MMKRRDFITLLGGLAVFANAQRSVTNVGVLSVGTVESTGHLVDVFVSEA